MPSKPWGLIKRKVRRATGGGNALEGSRSNPPVPRAAVRQKGLPPLSWRGRGWARREALPVRSRRLDGGRADDMAVGACHSPHLREVAAR